MWCDAASRPCVAPGSERGNATTGIATFVKGAGGAIEWICQRQTCAGRNSTEDEIIASTDATPRIQRWRNFAEAAGHKQTEATTLWLDNESNVKNMFNLSGANTQHLNKRLAFSRDVVQRIECRPQSTPGKDNCADALTKTLPTPEFERHADVLLGLAHARSFVD